MYFLYIYNTMKAHKRIILVPQLILNEGILNEGIVNILLYLESVNNTISFVDDDLNVKRSIEKVDLKKCKIKQFKDDTIDEFHDEIISMLSQVNGTEFIISKN